MEQLDFIKKILLDSFNLGFDGKTGTDLEKFITSNIGKMTFKDERVDVNDPIKRFDSDSYVDLSVDYNNITIKSSLNNIKELLSNFNYSIVYGIDAYDNEIDNNSDNKKEWNNESYGSNKIKVFIAELENSDDKDCNIFNLIDKARKIASKTRKTIIISANCNVNLGFGVEITIKPSKVEIEGSIGFKHSHINDVAVLLLSLARMSKDHNLNEYQEYGIEFDYDSFNK